MADDDNPFDLTGHKGGPERRAARVWTVKEQQEKLAGYIETPPDLWPHIRAGTHVRYYLKDGTFKAGGFVKANPFDTTAAGGHEVKRYFSMQSSIAGPRTPGYFTWLLGYEDVDRIYIKPDANVLLTHLTLKNAVTSLNENIRRIADFVKQLDSRHAALEARLATLESRLR